MVLIIFLRNHSRIKHKDAEIVPLSDAPQWGCLVKKTTRSFPPPPSSLLSFFNFSLLYDLLKETQKEGAWKQFNAFIETVRFTYSRTQAWQKQFSLLILILWEVKGPFRSVTAPNMASLRSLKGLRAHRSDRFNVTLL